MKTKAQFLVLGTCLAVLAGCASHAPAPVVDRTPPGSSQEKPLIAEPESNFYVVQKGETLMRIAVANKVSVKDLAAWNNLENPNKVETGQRLRIVPPADPAAAGKKVAADAPVAEVKPITQAAKVETRPLNNTAPGQTPAQLGPNTDTLKLEPRAGKLPYSPDALAKLQGAGTEPPKPAVVEAKNAPAPAPAAPAAADPKAAKTAVVWAWPVQGKKVLKAFDGSTSKGVDIAGNVGDPVTTADAGKVIYVGYNIRGYGNLVIIRHDNQFISAYASQNSQVLVNEKQQVTRGQKIAKIGKPEGSEAFLHFEIRKDSTPVDPLKFLPSRE